MAYSGPEYDPFEGGWCRTEFECRIDEAIPYCDKIGYVYPAWTSSYYIDSNIQEPLEEVYFYDGSFYTTEASIKALEEEFRRKS